MNETIGQIGSKRNPLIINLSDFNNTHFIDIRYWYFDKNKKEWCPTKKGVLLSDTKYHELLKCIAINNNKILNWLGVSYFPADFEKYRKTQEECLNRIKKSIGEVNTTYIDDKKIHKFFSIEHKGNIDTILFNTDHPFIQEFEDSIEAFDKEGIRKIFGILLDTYVRSKISIMDNKTINPKILFEQLEHNWSELLYNYFQELE